MVRLSFTLAFAALAIAAPQPLSPDPSGAKNLGNGQGQQFITGQCLSDADCASGCCAGLATGEAVCSGPDVGTAQGKQGCGFGGGAIQDPVQDPAQDDAGGTGGGEIDTSAPGAENVGTGNGQQFITGQCFSDADCASACCAGTSGSSTATCSAEAVSTVSGKTGCGFGA